MKRVRVDANVIDEHGIHNPGDIITLSDGEAQGYEDKHWGAILGDDDSHVTIETAESVMPEHETAELEVGLTTENVPRPRRRSSRSAWTKLRRTRAFPSAPIMTIC